MAEKKILVMGDVTKDTELGSAGNCPGNEQNCGEDYSGASSPFVFTPVNFEYKIKAKFMFAKGGSEDSYHLTRDKDVHAEFNLMQIQSFNKGAVGKDAAQELVDYYNGTLAQGGGPAMTKAFAEKVITEFHSELSKANWKTFFEKTIRNSIKTEALLQETFQDFITHSLFADVAKKAISYDGWNNKVCEKEYTVKVNLGVKPKFLKTCSLEDDKSRLKVVSPEKKFCKAFLAGIGEEKEVSDDNFFFEVTEKIDSSDLIKSFQAGTTLGNIENFSESQKVITPGNEAQLARDYKNITRDVFLGGAAQAGSGNSSALFQINGQYFNMGGNIGKTRIEAEIDMSGQKAAEDIYIRFELAIGPDGDVFLSRIAVGGKKASLGYALEVIARNAQGWAEQLWKLMDDPENPQPPATIDDVKDKGEVVGDKAEVLVDNSGATTQKTADAAAVVANTDANNPASVAAAKEAVAGAQSDAGQTLTAANDAKAAQVILSTGTNGLSSKTLDDPTAKAVTEANKTVTALAQAQNFLNQPTPNVAGAIDKMNEALGNATATENIATTIETKAQDVNLSLETLQGVGKNMTDQMAGGRTLTEASDNALKNLFATVEKVVPNTKGVAGGNNDNGGTMKDGFGGSLAPVPQPGPIVPSKTSQGTTDLQSENRTSTGDSTKNEDATYFYTHENGKTTGGPLATMGETKTGTGYDHDNDKSWRILTEESTGANGEIKGEFYPAETAIESQNKKFSQ